MANLQSRVKLFISFTISLLLATSFGFFMNERFSNMKNDKPLRVYFGSAGLIQEFDPALIHVQTQWAMIEALYSPLVEVDANGQVVGGWAHSFDWDGLTAVFQMRDDARASDGLPITAADAAFSLKRLLVPNFLIQIHLIS